MAKKVTRGRPKEKFVPCRIVELPPERQAEAARNAVAINPANAPQAETTLALVAMALDCPPDDRAARDAALEPAFLAFLTGKYWGSAGVNLSVSFLDTNSAELRNRILLHFNAWGEFCNVKFSWSQSGGDVRVSRGSGGYWSYLGTDIRLVPRGEPTMNLQSFTLNTPESEYRRVVRHEVGHTLGAPHEQLRASIVRRLDVEKTIAYFRRTQGWGEATTRANVLTPLEERSIMGSDVTDETSLMCYSIPGVCTTDGKPVLGGNDFSATDRAFAARVYPKAVEPPPDRVEVTIPRAGKWVWQETL